MSTYKKIALTLMWSGIIIIASAIFVPEDKRLRVAGIGLIPLVSGAAIIHLEK